MSVAIRQEPFVAPLGAGRPVLVFHSDRAVTDWCRERLPFIENLRPDATIGVALDGKPVAGILYMNNTSADIQMGVVIDKGPWLTRGLISAFFRYPFEQLGKLRVTCIVPKHHRASRRIALGLGFTEEGTSPKAYRWTEMFRGAMRERIDAACIYGMLRENCRWIRPRSE